jgi:hypothetical protein
VREQSETPRPRRKTHLYWLGIGEAVMFFRSFSHFLFAHPRTISFYLNSRNPKSETTICYRGLFGDGKMALR